MMIEITALVTGVLFHFSWTLSRAENPANIPFRLFFGRRLLAAATIQFLVWTTLSAGVYILSVFFLDFEARPDVRAAFALNAGLLVPALPRMGRLLKIRPFESGFSLVLRDAILRTERRVAWEVLQEKTSLQAINKLYEFHLPHLLVTQAAGREGEWQRAEHLLRVNHPHIKLALLLRLLGYKLFVKELQVLKDNPDAILPTWDGQERRLLKDAKSLEAYAERERRLAQGAMYARRTDEANLQADRLLEGSGLKVLALRELESSALAPRLAPEPLREEG